MCKQKSLYLQAVRISNKQMSHILSVLEKKYNVQASLIELGESTEKEFIKLGFTCILINDEPRPQCVVWSEVLANESLKAGKLQRHVKTKHPKFFNKPIFFFRRLEKELLNEKKTMKEFLSTSERCQKAFYEVAYLIAKDKNHTRSEKPSLNLLLLQSAKLCMETR